VLVEDLKENEVYVGFVSHFNAGSLATPDVSLSYKHATRHGSKKAMDSDNCALLFKGDRN
jgi:hypothetical protein